MMKLLIPLLALMLAQGAQADAVNDAFNEGAGFGKGSAGQGTGALGGDPSASIPGYTSSPPQAGYYGDVRGGDGDIAGKGASALTGDEAGQAALDAGTKNPAVTIDPDATFITTGTNAAANADTIADGTYGACSQKVVSKSTFENFTCERDVNVIQTCGRTGSVAGSQVEDVTTTQIVIDSSTLAFKDSVATYKMPKGRIASATFSYQFKQDLAMGESVWYLNVTTLGQKATMYDWSGDFVFTSRQSFTEGEPLTFTLGTRNNNPNGGGQPWAFAQAVNPTMYHFTLTITYETVALTSKSSITWDESCGFDKTTAISKTDSICTEPGSTKTSVINGVTYTQTSDCWAWTDSYVTRSDSKGTCESLMNDKNCTRSTTNCLQSESGVCTHQTETWECQRNYTSTGMLCGGDYFCQSGDCSDTDGAGDSGFDTAVAKLAALSAAGDDINKDQINIRAFTGQAMSCRKAMAGFSNCCVDSGWGNSIGLANCSDDEMALGKAKQKRITVSVGEACNRKALGVCIQKKQVYCVFQGKLARIVQEQGRRDQLHVGFGSGDSPDCRGISPEELQKIDFDPINFSDFYSDLQNNQNIPNADAMAAQAKDRINAQMSAQGGK